MRTHVTTPPVPGKPASAAGPRRDQRFFARRSGWTPVALQAMPEVGAANDRAEQEADAIADRVMRSPEGAVAPRASAPRCARCAGDEAPVQRAPLPIAEVARADVARDAPPIVGEALREGGAPLDPSLRAWAEPRFGHDFSQIQVHTSALAAASARALSARAYASGAHLVFGAGRYEPTTSAGRRLLAHELAHVVQQRGSGRALVQRDKELPSEFNKKVDRHAYDRKEFSGYFDGEVWGNVGLIYLRMKLQVGLEGPGWVHPNTGQPLGQAELASFKKELKQVVEDGWSNKYTLKPSCKLGDTAYRAYATVEFVASNPHAKVNLFRTIAGARSNAKPGEEANLQVGDTDLKSREEAFKGEKRTFKQITAVHEFGHLLGLQHVRADRANDDDLQYGITFHEKANVMGVGMEIGKANYEPFKRIAERYGKDVNPKCNVWTIV